MHPPNYNTMKEQDKRVSQGETKGLIVEPQLHFAQSSVPNQMNTVPLHAVDTTVPAPLMTKKEKKRLKHIWWIAHRCCKKTRNS